MNYTKEYFDNKIQQNQIKEAVHKALPGGVYYHNLIIAFAEMLADFTQMAFKEEVFEKGIKNKGINYEN